MLASSAPRPLTAACALAVAFALVPSARAQYVGHGAASVPPEAVKTYAPPPLDPAVSRRIQTMLDLRSPGLGMLTPDGRRLVFGWSITGTPAVWRLDAPGAFPIQLTGGEDRTSLSDITPDGRFLVLTRDRGGQEDPGIYLQGVEGGALLLVQHSPGRRAFPSFVTSDSRSLYFVANDIQADSYAVYRFALPSGPRELVFSEPGLWRIADFREGRGDLTLLLEKATGALSAEYYEWTTNTKTLRPLFGQGERTEYRAQYSASPSELLVLTNARGEFRRLYRWSSASGLLPVTPDVEMDVSDFVIDQARQRIYYTLNTRGYTRLRVMDARTLQPLALAVAEDADHVTFGTPSRDGRYVTIGVETSKAPRTSYVFDWDSQTLAQWLVPSAPEVDLSRFAVARLESYPARDGTKIPMFVRYPARCAPGAPPPPDPCPVIMDFHGGPEAQATPGFRPTAQLFVDAGFIFAQPNVRGSDGYGKSWLEADDGPRRLDIITDIDDAGRYWRGHLTRGGKSPRVGIRGGSYGGYSALVGMTMFAGTYDAGVSVVGVSNLLTFLKNTAPYRRSLRASEYGDPDKDAEALRKLSPITYLDRVKAPLLLIQGIDDPRVPAGEAIQIQEALGARGLDSRLILLEGEGHGAVHRGAQALVIGHTLRFFEEHLLGGKTQGDD